MNVSRAEPLLSSRFQRGAGSWFVLRFFVSALTPRAAPPVATSRDAGDDQQDEGPEREVEDRVDGVLGGTGGARSGQQEHEQQAAGDARDSSAEQVAEQEPFRAWQRQHDRHGGQQRWVQHRGQGEDVDASHAVRSFVELGIWGASSTNARCLAGKLAGRICSRPAGPLMRRERSARGTRADDRPCCGRGPNQTAPDVEVVDRRLCGRADRPRYARWWPAPRHWPVGLSCCRGGLRSAGAQGVRFCLLTKLPISSPITVTRYSCPVSISITEMAWPTGVAAEKSPKPVVVRTVKLK